MFLFETSTWCTFHCVQKFLTSKTAFILVFGKQTHFTVQKDTYSTFLEVFPDKIICDDAFFPLDLYLFARKRKKKSNSITHFVFSAFVFVLNVSVILRNIYNVFYIIFSTNIYVFIFYCMHINSRCRLKMYIEKFVANLILEHHH